MGSVGTRSVVVVLEGRAEGERLILQAKETTASVAALEHPGLTSCAGVCRRPLASARARGGDAAAVSACLGSRDTFDGAIADFAEACADQNALDQAALRGRDRGWTRVDDERGLTRPLRLPPVSSGR